MKKLRCAIYTRKSTEEGLDQSFNSLDAQREACEAYIVSQKHEGWQIVPGRFDDGAYSGATMKRPALQMLMKLVADNRIDIIVVYKVDRLTRSLADFAKMVEIFDANNVSFVSVTQQFNTTSSMGRLTLNVLLSFAQFEREVTAERIRDKIAASKRKGMWMGGLVPLGYDAVDRRLCINDEEASTVRTLFSLYLEHGSVRAVKVKADRLGLRTKVRGSKNGNRVGAKLFSRGHIYKLLSNPIYLGKVVHKGEVYDGKHQAIIDQDIWDRVQTKLLVNGPNRRSQNNARHTSLLAGLLFDEQRQRLSPSHANKQGKRYRYYVSGPDSATGEKPKQPWRIAAATLEDAIINEISSFLADEARVITALHDLGLIDCQHRLLLKRSADLREVLICGNPVDKRFILTALVERIQLDKGKIRIGILAAALCDADKNESCDHNSLGDLQIHWLEAPITFRRRGVETKIILGNQPEINVDPTLVALISNARNWMDELIEGSVGSVSELAERHGLHRADVGRILPLAFLAPDLVKLILAGKQPAEMTVSSLRRCRDLPIDWRQQGQSLGFS